MWKTSMGKIMVTRNPEPAMSGEHNVQHIHEESGEAPGWLYSHKGTWAHGPDAYPISFHELLSDVHHDRRVEGRRNAPTDRSTLHAEGKNPSFGFSASGMGGGGDTMGGRGW
jgi:hypothetical protein